MTVDMIKFLASMDIPLRQWDKYIDPESGFHLRELIADSREVVREEIFRLEVRQKRLELAARGLEDNEKYEKVEGYYQRLIPERNILCYPMDEPESQVDFHKKLSILFEIAREVPGFGQLPFRDTDGLFSPGPVFFCLSGDL